LRLCARNILGKKHFLWKAPSESAVDLPKDRRCTLAQLLASEHFPLFTHSHQQRLTSGMAEVCYSQDLGLVIATRHNTQNYIAELFFSLARQGIGATVRDFLNPEFCNT